jgi:hypothetical protein
MAWLSSADVQIEERAVYRWRYQYAAVNEEFEELFDMGDTDVVDGSVSSGDEVVRRIRVNIIDDRYPGLTKAAAITQLDTLRDDAEYGTATAEWNGAGGYDVVGQRYLVDPAGWSKWIRLEDLDAYSGGA